MEHPTFLGAMNRGDEEEHPGSNRVALIGIHGL
jgi:hypothetical protein